MSRQSGFGRKSKCHPSKPHHGHGLCWTCYYKKHRKTFIDRAKQHYNKNKARHKDQARWSWIKRIYGLDKENYLTLLKNQHGKCAICKRDPKKIAPSTKKRQRRHRELVVDHDHKTNRVRGLLCQHCNVLLFSLDSPTWLNKAKKYLERGRKNYDHLHRRTVGRSREDARD